MVIIAGFGNPLLDMIIKTNGNDLLRKYNLKDDDQTEFDAIKMKSLMDDIRDFPIEYAPGGCAQNTLRIFQWLWRKTSSAYIIGGIGIDQNGKTLQKLLENAGVATAYIQSNEIPTGISIAIINKENRSLIASIGAARVVNIDSFNEVTNNGELLHDVDIFYMEGFLIPDRDIFTKYILDFAKSQKKLFAFNINASYICKENPISIKYFAENCDILFGNMKEFEALSEVMNFSGNILSLAVLLSQININDTWKYKKMVIITNGSKNVICIHNQGQICEIDVPKVPSVEIKDTTGAGDSFVAGFLTGLFKHHPPLTCIKYGCWAAQQIIKQIGCKVPDYSPDTEKCVK